MTGVSHKTISKQLRNTEHIKRHELYCLWQEFSKNKKKDSDAEEAGHICKSRTNKIMEDGDEGYNPNPAPAKQQIK